MALPGLPDHYQQAAYEQMTRHLPRKWFHGLADQTSALYPLLWGVAFALAHVRNSFEQAARAAIPYLSGGPWLSLHMRSIGLERRTTETDESGRDRYQWEFRPTRNTRAGQLSALEHFLNLAPPVLRLETDRAAGKLGQFRIVLEDRTQPWAELDYSFVGEFIRRYVTNGILPSVDIQLQCLIYQALPAFQFYDQFPTSYTTQGTLWERPAFISPLRLDFARNLITQVSAAEWRSERDRLLQLAEDGRSQAPGAVFLYLSDPGSCPYLLCDYDLELTTEDIEQTFPARPWEVDGWHFYDGFPKFAPSTAVGFIAPFFEVPDNPLVQAATPLPLPELHEIPAYQPFPGETQTLLSEVIYYKGLDFTRFQVVSFFPVSPSNPDPEFTSPNLDLMKSGPWELALTEGDPRWGNFPPQGSTLTGAVFATLTPASIWWTDSSGDARSFTPLWDGVAVYLAIEFLLPKGGDRTIREAELTVDGDRVNYRRFGLSIDSRINTGFVFRVRGIGVN